MSRYIDADAFEVFGYDIPKEYDVESFGAGVCCVLDKLDKQPTADVRENDYCENISESGFLCNACRFGDFDGFHGYKPKYCPNCGRKVRGGKHERTGIN